MILIVAWLAGMLSHVGGTLIHLVPVIAVIALIANLMTGRKSTV